MKRVFDHIRDRLLSSVGRDEDVSDMEEHDVVPDRSQKPVEAGVTAAEYIRMAKYATNPRDDGSFIVSSCCNGFVQAISWFIEWEDVGWAEFYVN